MLQDELNYMYRLQRFGVKPGLAVMQRLMEALDHPEKKFKSVHIAGTNGKGSTAAFIDSVLRQQGYMVGLYTSPHLVRFNERIRLGGQEISDQDLARLVKTVRQAMGKHGIEATFFEFTTALAFLYFAEAAVDVAVIEVGMGGRLDATNVLTPMVSVVTTIGLDHVEVLGDTLLKIAAEKAGIIKEGVPVVTGEKNAEIVSYFEEVAGQRNTSVVVAARQLPVTDIQTSLAQQSFAVTGLLTGHYAIHLLGRHQIDNAITALATVYVLRQRGMEISDQSLTQGLLEARWEGRMEVVSPSPLIIVDGAHNIDGAKALYGFIKGFSQHSVLVLAQKRGKELRFMMEYIAPLFSTVIVTEGIYEPMPAHVLADMVRPYNSVVEVIPDVGEAVERALALLAPDGFLLVTGSLYMIGGAIETLRARHT